MLTEFGLAPFIGARRGIYASSVKMLALSGKPMLLVSKVNSVQEACAKCFAVHILKFEILQIT